MHKGTHELTAIAADIAGLAAEAPARELPGAKGVATVALSGATVITVMGAPAGAGEHVVRPGDTLSELAESYETSVAALAELNDIQNPHTIYADSILQVPDAMSPAMVTAENGASPWSIARDVLGREAATGDVKHLAERIIEHNGIEVKGRRAVLAAGTELVIPDYQTRTIKPGETASEIARETGVEVADLRDRSGTELTDPHKIFADDRLILPAVPTKIEQPDVKAATQEPVEQKPVEPKAPQPLVIKETPQPEPQPAAELQPTHYDYSSIPEIHGVDEKLVKDVTKYLIEKHGLTAKGAAYLTGNFIQESQLDPNAVGDSGTAHGVAQWRFERRDGMPEGDLYGQIDFALTVEMDRDGIAADLNELLRDPNATDAQIRDALKRWERWGHEGKRFAFAQTIEEAVVPAAAEPAPVTPQSKPQPQSPQSEPVEAKKAVETDPFDHPLIEKVSRRVAPGRHGETIEIVKVAGEYVHIDVAVNVAKMLEHAQREGINLTLTSAWRDIAEQEDLRIQNGCPDVYESSASTCDVPTAIPGTSMHNGGQALDLGENGQRLSNQAFSWLQANAGTYGFKNLPSEPWHWSVNGK